MVRVLFCHLRRNERFFAPSLAVARLLVFVYTQTGVDDLRTDLLPHADPDIEEGPLTMEDSFTPLNTLKTGKSAGQDNIPNELWENLAGEGLEALLELFQNCWSHRKSPASWKQSQVIGIFKEVARATLQILVRCLCCRLATNCTRGC